MNSFIIEKRKAEHIEVCLKEDVEGKGITNGLENYRFKHHALPEINYNEIDLSSFFLNKKISSPFLISSMTGGTPEASDINKNLALAAEKKGWAMGVGSMRAYIENESLASTFKIRKYAPSIPIFSNIGAVQLNYGFGIEACKKSIDLIAADGIVLHLNSIQEVIQPEGNTNFKGLLSKIEKLCNTLEVPVGVKEIGWGISSDVAQSLSNVGVAFIDVAGAGGTSWSQVEKYRAKSATNKQLGEAFIDWGIPTADCIKEVRMTLPEVTLIGSGGIKNGVEAAKAIALGSDLVGIGRSLLTASLKSSEQTYQAIEVIEEQLKLAMFGVGALTIKELKKSNRLYKYN